MKKKLAVLLCAVLAIATIGCTSVFAEEAAEPYQIGICQIVQHPALDAATEGFMDAVIDELGEDAVVFDVQNASGDPATCPTIVNLFVSANVDLIMANATAPLQAAAQATADIPVLGTSITDYASALGITDWTGKTGYNVSGTSDLAPLSEQAAMLNELFPEAKKVGILYCTAESNSLYQANVITEELTALGYEVTSYGFTDTNDVALVTETACAESEVLYIPTDNTAASNTGVIDQIARPAGIPIIAGEEGICSGCGVATLSISYYNLGYTTGLMAVEILANGADITEMDVQFAPEVTKKYNAEICAELGIEVPEDYEAIATEEATEEEAEEDAEEAEADFTKVKVFEGTYGFGDAEITVYTNDAEDIFYITFESFDEDQILEGTVKNGICMVSYDETGFMAGDCQQIWDDALASENAWEPVE